MAKNNSFCGSIEVFRYIFTTIVCLMHFWAFFWGKGSILGGGYIAVDFFFVLSGFFLCKSAIKSGSAMMYSIRHYISVLFICTTSILVSVFLHVSISLSRGGESLLIVFGSIPDLLSIQMSGIFYPTHNGALWYVSSMIIAGYFISFLYLNHKETFVKLLAPVFVIIGYSMINYYTGNLDSIGKDKSLIIPLGLIRAFAGMSLGVITYEITSIRFLKRTLSNKVMVIIELVLFGQLMSLMCLQHHSINDFLALLCIPPIIAIAYKRSTILSKFGDLIGCRLIQIFGKQFTLSVYAFSTIVYTIMGKFVDFVTIGPYLSLTIFLPILLLISWIVSKFADPITTYFNNLIWYRNLNSKS